MEEVTDFLTGTRAQRDQEEWMVTDRPDLRIIQPEEFQAARETFFASPSLSSLPL